MAEVKEIKALFKAMMEHDITELEMELAGEKITIRRQQTAQEFPHADHIPRAPLKEASDHPEMES